MKKLNVMMSLLLITGVCAFALIRPEGPKLSLSPELTFQIIETDLQTQQPELLAKKTPVKKSAGDIYYQTEISVDDLSGTVIRYNEESEAYVNDGALVFTNGSNVENPRSFINLAPYYFSPFSDGNIEIGYKYVLTYQVMADHDCTYSAIFAYSRINDEGSISGFGSLGKFTNYELTANVPVSVTVEFNFVQRPDGVTEINYPTLYSYFTPTAENTNFYVYPLTYTVYENGYAGWGEITWYDNWSVDSAEGVEGTSSLTSGVSVGDNGMSFTVPAGTSLEEPMIKIPLSGFTLEASNKYSVEAVFGSDISSDDKIYVYATVNSADGDIIIDSPYYYGLNNEKSTVVPLTKVGEGEDYQNLSLYVYLVNTEAQTAPKDLNVNVNSINIKCDTPDLSMYPALNYDSELDMYTYTDDNSNTLGFDSNGNLLAVMTANEEVTVPEMVVINGSGVAVECIDIDSNKWTACPSLKTINAPSVTNVSNLTLSANCSLERINVHKVRYYSIYGYDELPDGKILVIHSDLPVYGFYPDNYDGKIRYLIGNETLDAPVHTGNSIDRFYDYDAENDAWIGYIIDNRYGVDTYQVSSVHTSGTKVRIPEYITFPNDNSQYPISKINGIYSNYYHFTENAPALTDLYISNKLDNINISWDSNGSIKNIHLYGDVNNKVPQLYTSLPSGMNVYFPSKEMLEYFQENAGSYWRYANFIPEGWEYELLEVNVARRGEFAQTLLELTDFDWSAAHCVKVTGRLNENDLKNMKEMTNIQVLDISEADFDALPANWLSSKQYLRKVILPDYVTSIPSGAFSNCRALNSINLENITDIQGSAFYSCSSLVSVDIPAVTYLGEYAFNGCSALTEIELPEGLTYIGSRCFSDTRLKEVVIPEGIWMIASYLFYNVPTLTSVTLPSTLTRIDGYAFYNTGISSIEIPEGVTQIANYAFNNCTRLESLVLPSTLTSIGGYMLGNCTSLKTVTSKAAVPPTAGNTFTTGVDMTKVTLYALPFAIDAYRNADYWSNFYIVKPLLEPVSSIVIDRPVNFDLLSEDNEVLANNPSVLLKYSSNFSNVGQLTTEGDGTLSASYFEMWPQLTVRNQYSSYRSATLINNAENMRADNVNVSMEVETNRWHFFSLPYDVDMSNITVNEGTDFVIRRYDSEKRAVGDNTAGSNWITVGEDETLTAGQGYILQAANNVSGKAYVKFISGNTLTKNNIFRSGDYTATLQEYTSEFAQNRSWNFVGNPYPCFYRLNTLLNDFYQPVTIWRGSAYQAYSPIDDDVILRPFEAFFVQCPLDGNEMTFSADGRMHFDDVYHGSFGTPGYTYAPAKINSERVVFNFNIGTEELSDRARIVFNESAGRDYEIERDAAKMFADVAEGVEIYVNDGIIYSICERPLEEGNATLGVRVAAEGEYTLSLESRNAQGWKVMLTDNLTGITVDLTASDYQFESAAGDFADRFTLSFVNVAQGINTVVSADTVVRIYNLQGIEVYEGVFGDFRGENEIYVVVSGDRSFKVQL